MEGLRAVFRRYCSRIFLLGAALLFSAQSPVTSTEYQIKAVFLFNFAQFIEWPAASFPKENAPLIIGVLGKDPFEGYLDKTIDNEMIGGHPLLIRRYLDISEVKGCHILFISPEKKNKLEPIFAGLKSEAILTVGDVDNFIREGGMIRFFLEDGKIRMQINLEAARKAELKISSKLLRVADIVTAKSS